MSEMWHVVKVLVRCEQIKGLDDDTMEEMCSRNYKSGNGKEGVKTEVAPKETMKKKIGHSPDRSDGMVLSVHAARLRCGLSSTEKGAPKPKDPALQRGIFHEVYGDFATPKKRKAFPWDDEPALAGGGWGEVE